MIKPKKDYNKKVYSVKAQLGFPDYNDVNYLNKKFKRIY